MDLLSAAYGAASDDDADGTSASPPPPKRPRWGFTPYLPPPPFTTPQPAPPQPAPLLAASSSGRYVSKRERALLAAGSEVPRPPPLEPEFDSPVIGSLTDSNIRADILRSLRCQPKPGSTNNTPLKLSVSLRSHTKAVNCVDWSPSHGHLLASAGMDHTVHIWNVWNKGNTISRVLKHHTAAVKDVRWSYHQPVLLSGGFDCSSRLVDAEEGKEIRVFKEDQAVEVIKFNPSNSNLFMSGGSKGSLRLWDIRTGLATKQFDRSLGTILDIEFSADGKQFISSTDTTRSNVSENTIIIWDILRQVPLSNQVYTEAFTCPCVRYHPYEASFVAQSNGNYIAIFSSRPPFKLNRYRRFEGHGVWGFPIKCSFSLSGRELASGSSDGCIYFYDYKSSKFLRKIEASKEACTYIAYHPVIPNVIASCSWTGEVSVFE
uniref:Uncharacterized protein n=2 Tax=Avena sativa TaxID=4498 RepID=A0ACD5Z090_AVESA